MEYGPLYPGGFFVNSLISRFIGIDSPAGGRFSDKGGSREHLRQKVEPVKFS
jgi:hypothetical protein